MMVGTCEGGGGGPGLFQRSPETVSMGRGWVCMGPMRRVTRNEGGPGRALSLHFCYISGFPQSFTGHLVNRQILIP